ncbi:hypothetical protein B0A67_16500 [Flavobacterium aquidurense]|jgi:hypothetical protein|uniref:hypothetical protein n=1 Tax=Flavobacterium aquidurense TaxID=362413 RepID=UPI0009238972|nr:hypothetical protein [Flavobacterium aquidurense]OXA70241.1 hypothetical protein B0A67_16500 [Flavobacterium aquidurense]SHH10880.1 hypothetical protein SAMN05444481_111151 [Flavobacterium frigidimaris]
MKKYVFGILLVSVLFSCNGSKEKKIEKKTNRVSKVVAKDSLKKDEFVADEEFKNDFDILLPRSYRTYDNLNPVSSLTKKWIDLYEDNGEYFLGKADFEIEKSFDECSGDSLQYISSKNKTIIFIDYPELKVGKVKSLKINKDKIWPKEKVVYTFNGVTYTFRAAGKVLSEFKVATDDDKEEIFKNVANYKLYLKIGDGAEKLLLAEDSFQDTFVVLRFAGDIDGDGKLDFVFGANRNYEEQRVILFLSSKAENGEDLKKVSEIAVQFDC